jgi:GT2 family glycosyltransferase
VIIVVYNRPLATLPALQAARDHTDADWLRWVVVDNSPTPEPMAPAIAAQHGMDYLPLLANRGIAAAFNRGIDHLGDAVDYVIFLDQDTGGVTAYLDAVTATVQQASSDVVMPTVFSGPNILSPCERVGYRYRPMKNPGTLPSQFSCINSGLIVRRGFLHDVMFDERLFLDFVDHQFIEDCRTAGATFHADGALKLHQDFSRETDTKDQALHRFRIFAQDARTFYRGKPFGTTWASIVVGWRRINAAKQYRTIDFFRPTNNERSPH